MSVELFFPFCIAFVFLVLIQFWNRSKSLPPGPWGLPMLGHLPFLGSKPQRTLMDWKKKYGPIIYGRMGSFPCVFLCDSKVIKQAFSMAELAGRGDLDAIVDRKLRKGLILGEGPRHTEQRHFALSTLKDFGLGRKAIEGHIQDSLGQFVHKIETQGRNGRPMESLRISTAYVISSLYRIMLTDELSDEDANRIAHVIDKMGELGSIISQLAIFMPCIETIAKLVSFGLWSVTEERRNSFKTIYEFSEGQIAKHRSSWVKGEPRDVIDAYLDMTDKTSDVQSIFHSSHDSVTHFAGDLVAAGVHTTSTALEWVFLYMATYPSIQIKLQEEIDMVVGPSRIPNFGDRLQMPYADAAIYELLRLSTLIALGVEHKCLKDVTLQGYQIPKGTLLLANLYGVHYDPKVWGEDVEQYKPERWLGETGRKLKRDHFLPFSSGKRSCIGETLARDTLFIFITGIFQKFTVSFEEGCSGPGLEPIVHMTSFPVPFNVVFTPRLLD